MEKDIATLIKTLRIKRNMTPKELSIDSEVNYQQLSKYERGKSYPTDEVLKRLAKSLHVRKDFFHTKTQPEVGNDYYKKFLKAFMKVELTEQGQKSLIDFASILLKSECIKLPKKDQQFLPPDL